MKLYRFSPIKNEKKLLQAIEHVHSESHKLCQKVFGKYLPNAGNIGIFCHYDDEYEYLTKLRKNLTKESENWNQKYFRLNTPIVIPAKNGLPETTYEFLYIRQPDPYRHHVGDVDFYLEKDKYNQFKERLEKGEKISGSRMYPSSKMDMIELYNPDSDVCAYVNTIKALDIINSN